MDVLMLHALLDPVFKALKGGRRYFSSTRVTLLLPGWSESGIRRAT